VQPPYLIKSPNRLRGVITGDVGFFVYPLCQAVAHITKSFLAALLLIRVVQLL
jgi:hypothetical protein